MDVVNRKLQFTKNILLEEAKTYHIAHIVRRKKIKDFPQV